MKKKRTIKLLKQTTRKLHDQIFINTTIQQEIKNFRDYSKQENKLRFDSEELECVNKYLDDLGIPKLHIGLLGDPPINFSTVGRIRYLLIRHSSIPFQIRDRELKKFEDSIKKES